MYDFTKIDLQVMYNVYNAGMENFNKKSPKPISLKPNNVMLICAEIINHE